ncbi:GNAT family N-acetyltransferase [Salmonirosea aquatica]|uniref:GNAT family N-acetyltransferase n=1 Tax=Salmonirosea aquatica TaxID=2654236 RepID=A0A7C9BKD9_9BACT|nr:GNAT family N-acetyltransferase [Cytophagaceae bacterium SJW1-29]
MVEATHQDRELAIEILAQSFQDNLSVNYLIPQDSKRMQRIRELMAYSFDLCTLYGKAVLSENKKACALVIFPDLKRTSVQSLLLSGRLIFKAMGIGNIGKALSRENQVAQNHPSTPIYHLWFLGVLPESQGRGIGGKLLDELLADAVRMNRSVYLETSTLRNISWYEGHGFSIYGKILLSYTLYLMRNNT